MSDGFLKGIRAWACSHPETTPPDEKGQVICVKCGATYPLYLTREMFEDALRKAREK